MRSCCPPSWTGAATPRGWGSCCWSAIGGITDIVEDGVSGLLVPPGDAPALAAALGRLAGAPDLAAGLGEAGYRRLRERFDWDAITRRWLEVYAAAVRQG